MKNLILPLLLYGAILNSQNAFYDAITVSQFVVNGKLIDDQEAFEVYGPILNSYLDIPAPIPDYKLLRRKFAIDTSKNFNPILTVFFDFDIGGGASAPSGLNAEQRGFLSSIGNIDVTSFADGLAKFLVARAKEELNVAFFRKFQEFIKRFPEVQVIFPNTFDIITQISSYQYAAFLPALRSAFHLDMNSFSNNLVNLRNLTSSECPLNDNVCKTRIDTIHAFLNNHPVGRTFVAAFLVSDGVMEGRNAVEILNDIANDELCLGQTDNFSDIIRFTNLISNSIRSKEEGELWITKNEFKKLFENEVALKVYLGLLYSINKVKQDPIVFSTSIIDSTLELADLLVKADEAGNTINEFRSNFRNLGLAAADVSLYTNSIQGDDQIVNEASILKFADYAHSLSEFLVKAVTFFNNENSKLANDVHLFALIVDEAVDACYDIQSKNYTSLVLHTSEILDTLLKKEDPTFKNDYIKYGTFMANIVEADNSDEVKAAIEAAVLPVGSSSIKRETFSNISLNAYIGPMAGMEYLGAQTEDQWATVVGVTAPLGVAFNWGNYGNGLRDDSPGRDTRKNGNEKGGKSFTLFIPLIDVGSIATYRLSDDSSDVAADIKLENIIAPGLYFYYGFGKIPLSLGIGGQVGAQLREINATDINVDKNFYMRFGLNLVVDIPFFNFYTRN